MEKETEWNGQLWTLIICLCHLNTKGIEHLAWLEDGGLFDRICKDVMRLVINLYQSVESPVASWSLLDFPNSVFSGFDSQDGLMEWTRGNLVYRVTHWGLELWSQILCILSSIGKENSKETFNFEKYFKSTAWTYFYLGFCKAIICFSPWTCSLEDRAQFTALWVYAAASSFISTVCNLSESIVETYPIWISYI